MIAIALKVAAILGVGLLALTALMAAWECTAAVRCYFRMRLWQMVFNRCIETLVMVGVGVLLIALAFGLWESL